MIKRVFIILIVFAVLFMSGCLDHKSIEARRTAIHCVEEDEDSLLEMFAIFDKHNIESIHCSTEAISELVLDGKYFNVVTAGKDVDISDKDILRACEILGDLFTAYGVNDISNYPDVGIEIRFISRPSAILYSPDTLPPEDLNAEEIKDGFYTYMLKPMF